MIGRKAIGNPWLFSEKFGAQRGRLNDWRQTLLQHFDKSLELYGTEMGLRQFRKHLAAYLQLLPNLGSRLDTKALARKFCQIEKPGPLIGAIQGLQ